MLDRRWKQAKNQYAKGNRYQEQQDALPQVNDPMHPLMPQRNKSALVKIERNAYK
jgi:hypothetical protein